MERSPTAIDLFCGAGGLSLGIQRAGFDVRLAVDNDVVATKTYAQNFPSVAVSHSSLEGFSAETLLEKSSLQASECTLVAGGPPCQGFSIQRRGDRTDERNDLVKVFLDLALAVRPRFFLIENVLGFLSKQGREFYTYVQKRSIEAGYRNRARKLNAADYGIPQVRLRAFIVGERLDDGKSYFRFPEPLLPAEQYVTVRQAIGDLPSPPEDGSPHSDFHNHFREGNLSSINRRRISHVPEGGGREHLPEDLQLACHKKENGHRHLDVYGRLAWDQPSVTLTARFDSFTRGRFAHPTEHRTITLREGARLQSFPDDFRFLGNREEVARQIGNAVPPLLGECLAHAMLDALLRREESQPSLEELEPELQFPVL